MWRDDEPRSVFVMQVAADDTNEGRELIKAKRSRKKEAEGDARRRSKGGAEAKVIRGNSRGEFGSSK